MSVGYQLVVKCRVKQTNDVLIKAIWTIGG